MTGKLAALAVTIEKARCYAVASGASSPSFYKQFDRGSAFVLLCTSGKVCGLVVATSEEKSWGVENRRCGQQHPYPLCARPRETPVIRGDEGTIIVSTYAEIRVTTIG
jgi:hypothetical protein